MVARDVVVVVNMDVNTDVVVVDTNVVHVEDVNTDVVDAKDVNMVARDVRFVNAVNSVSISLVLNQKHPNVIVMDVKYVNIVRDTNMDVKYVNTDVVAARYASTDVADVNTSMDASTSVDTNMDVKYASTDAVVARDVVMDANIVVMHVNNVNVPAKLAN